MRIAAVNLIQSSGPVTLSSSWFSEPIYMGHMVNFSAQMVFTGVPEGTFAIQYSNDPVEPTTLTAPTNFASIPESEQIIDEAGVHGWNVDNAGYRWIRFTYQYTAGMGVLTSANLSGKGV